MGQPVRVGGRTGRVHGQLGGHGLAEEHRPGASEQGHGAGVGHRAVPGEDGRAVRGRLVGGVEVVLGAEGQPPEWAVAVTSVAPAPPSIAAA